MDKGHRRYERSFFSLLLLVFDFSAWMAIATFSPSPCQEICLCSDILPKCSGLPWGQQALTGGSAPSGERAVFQIIFTPHLHTAPSNRGSIPHALSVRELLALLQRAQVCASE